MDAPVYGRKTPKYPRKEREGRGEGNSWGQYLARVISPSKPDKKSISQSVLAGQ